ncbi:hypothetical protein EON67_03655 [archaeon]|nr:MAG: hypothetical protein EON67_03655 [archaeon]
MTLKHARQLTRHPRQLQHLQTCARAYRRGCAAPPPSLAPPHHPCPHPPSGRQRRQLPRPPRPHARVSWTSRPSSSSVLTWKSLAVACESDRASRQKCPCARF